MVVAEAPASATTVGSPSATDQGDGLWLMWVAVTVLVLCGVPYLVSAVFGPPDLERAGTFWFSRDFSQYAAAMREGARSSGWLIHDHFSAESHAAAFMYPLYVAAGKVASLLQVDDRGAFVALEWAGRLAVVGGVYAFCATFIGPRLRRTRRLAVLLTLATLGLDAWAIPVRRALDSVGLSGIAAGLPDTLDPYLEVGTFGVLFSAPHLMLGLALTLLCAPAYVRATRRGGRRWLALLGATVFGLSLVHAFNVPVLVSILAIHAAITGRRAWPAAAVAAATAAPMVIYSLVVYQTDAFWSATYGAQNLMPSPPPWALPFNFGIVMLAAPLAWPLARGWPREVRLLIGLWIGLGLVWMYAPLPYQRRFAFGVQPGLAVLAASGLFWSNAWLRAHLVGNVRRRLFNYAVALMAISTSVLMYLSLVGSAVFDRPLEVYAWSRPEAAAATWLGQHSSSTDVVLASAEFANPLGGVIDGRVVYGHAVATLHAAEKEALVDRFYSAETPSAERAQILAQSRASVVAFGPPERALGGVDPSPLAGLDLVYDRDGVQFFRIDPASVAEAGRG